MSLFVEHLFQSTDIVIDAAGRQAARVARLLWARRSKMYGEQAPSCVLVAVHYARASAHVRKRCTRVPCGTWSGSRSRARSGRAKGERGGALWTDRAGNPSQSATTLRARRHARAIVEVMRRRVGAPTSGDPGMGGGTGARRPPRRRMGRGTARCGRRRQRLF